MEPVGLATASSAPVVLRVLRVLRHAWKDSCVLRSSWWPRETPMHAKKARSRTTGCRTKGTGRRQCHEVTWTWEGDRLTQTKSQLQTMLRVRSVLHAVREKASLQSVWTRVLRPVHKTLSATSWRNQDTIRQSVQLLLQQKHAERK